MNIKQLENEIHRKNKRIKKLEKNSLQLKDIYFECNSILTILYQKAQDISLEKTQAQIKNILSTWYKNEWLYILNKYHKNTGIQEWARFERLKALSGFAKSRNGILLLGQTYGVIGIATSFVLSLVFQTVILAIANLKK